MKRLSYYTVIGRSPKLLSFHLDNLTRNAGLDRSDYDINVVIYRNNKIPQATTNEIVDICLGEYKTNIGFYDEKTNNFLINLYACWNYGYNMGSAPLVLRGGSDQAFSPNSFRNMLEAHENYSQRELITQMHTVENITAGPNSRHFTKDWGNWDNFNEEAFNAFAIEHSREGLFTADEALNIWGHPTDFTSSLGPNTRRTDGVSWLCSRALFNKIGPMQPINWQGITGDVTFHDAAQLLGIPNFLVGNAFSWHGVRGESGGITQ